ncbi:MAG: PorT family protein, partial [Paraprevotella sp.]|nr:PorT family protein [Paraprevotella sp.]
QAVQENYEGEPLYASRWRDYQRNSYFGLRFGLNIPTIRYQGTGGHAQTDPLPRYHLGLIYGNKLGNGLPFFLETGLFYTEKGAKIQAWDELGYRKCTLRYLEVPLVLKYKLDTNIDDFSVQPFFGGFMAVGVGGNMKDYDYRTQNSPFGTSRYKRFDAGLRVGCGIAFQNFYFEMGDDIGLFNIAGRNYAEYNYDNFDGHIRTGNFIMSVGVNF